MAEARETDPSGRRRRAVTAAGFLALGLLLVGLPAAGAASGASFAGTGLVLVVGRTASGAIVQMSMSGVAYAVAITPSSLEFRVMGMAMGGPLASGSITIGPAGATGGGTLGGDMPSQMGFVASKSGGQFQCLMAGFSAGFSLTMDGMTLTILQMDVHGAVAPGTYVAA